MKNQCSHYSRQLTKEEVIQIINLQNANISSADIASIKNLKGSCVHMIKHHNKLHAALPRWTIIKKRVTNKNTTGDINTMLPKPTYAAALYMENAPTMPDHNAVVLHPSYAPPAEALGSSPSNVNHDPSQCPPTTLTSLTLTKTCQGTPLLPPNQPKEV